MHDVRIPDRVNSRHEDRMKLRALRRAKRVRQLIFPKLPISLLVVHRIVERCLCRWKVALNLFENSVKHHTRLLRESSAERPHRAEREDLLNLLWRVVAVTDLLLD